MTGDLFSLETYDGKKIYMPDGDSFVLSFGGFGMPPVEYITAREYLQHGETLIDYMLSVRDFSLHLHRNSACDRQTYWDRRKEFNEFFRPNRNGKLKVTIRQPDGNKRSIYARANPGMVFPEVPDVNNWAIDEVVSFVAHDPVWFNPDAEMFTSTGSIADHLIFSIDFPIRFGPEGISMSTGDFIYDGTWVTYPIITVDGPYSSVIITSKATGASIYLNTPISEGKSREIDTAPGAQHVIDQDGENKISEVDPLSDFVNFAILPHPLAPYGQNNVSVRVFGSEVNVSRSTIAFNSRYIGI